MTLNPFQLRKREPKREHLPDLKNVWLYIYTLIINKRTKRQRTKNQNQAIILVLVIKEQY